MIFSNQVSRRAQKRSFDEQKGLVVTNSNYKQVSAAARGSELAQKIRKLRAQRKALAAGASKAVAKALTVENPKKGSGKGSRGGRKKGS